MAEKGLMKKITFVSHNRGKVKLFTGCARAAGFEAVHVELPLIEPQADSVEAVAQAKAKQAFDANVAPLVVEDSGFYIDALSGFPGPYTKYVLATIGVAGLLRLIGSLPSRACRFVSALVYVGADGSMQTFTDDQTLGSVAMEHDSTPTQDAWSDLWGIFIPAGASRPVSALSPAERDALWAQWQTHSVYAQFARWISHQAGPGR
jgi:non-canonical purine NTP pyrophosphatase (RdgB/HAM1 family)